MTTQGVSVAEHGEHDKDGRWQHRGYRGGEQGDGAIREDVDRSSRS